MIMSVLCYLLTSDKKKKAEVSLDVNPAKHDVSQHKYRNIHKSVDLFTGEAKSLKILRLKSA